MDRRIPAHFVVSVISRVALDETGGKHVDYLNSSSLLMIMRDGLAIWRGGQMPKGLPVLWVTSTTKKMNTRLHEKPLIIESETTYLGAEHFLSAT